MSIVVNQYITQTRVVMIPTWSGSRIIRGMHIQIKQLKIAKTRETNGETTFLGCDRNVR